jgi:hypothetical protein
MVYLLFDSLPPDHSLGRIRFSEKGLVILSGFRLYREFSSSPAEHPAHRHFVNILRVPYAILSPLIALICFVGAFSVNNSQTVASEAMTATLYQTGTTITATDWPLANFGQDLIACPAGGAIYYYQPGGALTTAQILGPQTPLVNDGIFIAMPERQIVAFGSSFTLAPDPLNVRWSDVGDPTTWIATAVNQAGSYRIPSGSKIVSALQGPQTGFDLDRY